MHLKKEDSLVTADAKAVITEEGGAVVSGSGSIPKKNQNLVQYLREHNKWNGRCWYVGEAYVYQQGSEVGKRVEEMGDGVFQHDQRKL